MSAENCTHDCSSCGESCSSRTAEQTSFLANLAPESSVKKVIGIVSGKGGVGKSLVTALMAVEMNRKGKRTAILDADITGPSIPKAFGIGSDGVATTPDGRLMVPAKSLEGVEIMSANLLLDKDTDPIISRRQAVLGRQVLTTTPWFSGRHGFTR